MSGEKSERVEVRVDSEEKLAFQMASEISGVPVSSWIRSALRRAARRDLQEANEKVPFLNRVGK